MSGGLTALFDLLRRRLFFLALVAAIIIIGLIIRRVTSSVAELEERLPPAGIEPVVAGKFLGVPIIDHTHDKFLQNAWLRLAMNEGFKSSNSVRQYQLGRIFLQDGQHPDDGKPAVIVVVEPKQHELPDPPFETVAVRRWRPPPETVVSDERLLELQRSMSPDEVDLAELREVWSGGRYAELKSLFGTFPWLFAVVICGGMLILVAGAYRTQSWWATRWDRGADVTRESGALAGMRAARESRQQKDSMDMS